MKQLVSKSILKLTDLQRQIWRAHLLYPGAATLSAYFDLPALDPLRWQEAFTAVVDADPLLSSRVTGTADRAQLVTGRLHSFPAAVREMGEFEGNEMDRLIEDRRALALEPRSGLVDSLLVCGRDGRLRWFLALHHLIADGWSFKVILERTARAYLGRRPTPDRNPAFRHFARGLASYQRSPAARADRDYWHRRLSSPRPPLFPAPREGTPRVARVEALLSPGRSSLVDSLSRSIASGSANRKRAALFTAALLVYLAATSGERRIAIGMPFANRRGPGERSAIGLFMRIGVLRPELRPEDSLMSLAERVAEEIREIRQHLGVPLANANNRHFEVMVNLHTVDYDLGEEIPVREQWLHSGNDGLPLTLHVRTSRPDRFLLELDLREELFAPPERTAARDRLLTVIERLTDHPESPLQTLELLPDPPGPSVAPVSPGPGTGPGRATAERLHELFDRRAAERSNRPALYSAAGRLTFGELRERSDLIRDALLERGCPVGAVVALSMERSIGSVAVLLGILKAGAIWLPLDPAYPAELRRYMLNDSGALLTVVDPRLKNELERTAPGHPLLVVDPHSGTIPRDERDPIESRVGPLPGAPHADPARSTGEYASCLYTSGSTGRPKGVLGKHSSAINRLRWMWNRFPLADDEVLLQKTSLNFVDSVWEIFGGLLAGRPIVIVDDHTRADPQALAAVVEHYPVERIILVPTLLRALLRAPGGLPAGLRRIAKWYLTGELLTSELVRALLRAHPGAEVFNLYGTTETSDAACHRITPEELTRPVLPIGSPIDNMELLILDEALDEVGTGEIGELYLRGAGVGDGYLNHPELSAGRFLPDPSRPGRLLFRTGDRARRDPTGLVECVGRRDNLVKLAGYRIELEGVEELLRGHRSVADALAVVLPEEAQRERLHAFVLLAAGMSARGEELQGYLRERLPQWMIPTITLVSELPRTPSGKLARDDLAWIASHIVPPHGSPRGGQRRVGRERSVRGRRGHSVEAILKEIWRDLLKVPEIGLDDDFFELGGDSLGAVQMIARVEKRLGLRIPLAAVYRSPTVRLLAMHSIEAVPSAVSPVPIRRGGPDRLPLFSVPPAGSSVSAFERLARWLPESQPLYSFQPRGIEVGERPHLTIDEMASAYVAEMKRLHPHGPYCLSGRCFGGYVAYEMAQQLIAAGDRVELLIIIDSPEAPLEADRQRLHVGVRKLLRYYPQRLAHFLRRGRLLYTARMKLRNELRYAIGRVAIHLPMRRERARERRLQLLRYLHTRAFHHYVARPYPGRVVMLWAADPPDLTGERERWSRLATGGIEWHVFQSEHHELLKDPTIREVGTTLGAVLDRAQANREDDRVS